MRVMWVNKHVRRTRLDKEDLVFRYFGESVGEDRASCTTPSYDEVELDVRNVRYALI